VGIAPYNPSVNACGIATSLYTREADRHQNLRLPCKGSWMRACEQTEGFANKQDSPILFSQSQHNISHPTAKEKAGDCSPAFFDLIRPGGIVVIKAAGALCAGIVAYIITALVNTTAACAGFGEYSEDVERFYLHLRSTITLFHVKFLL